LPLNGQEPPLQEDAVGQLPVAQGKEECSWTLALKEESCFSSFFPPHFGHASGRSALDRISCSNTAEHFSHLYS
jgi:hypothetical protein